MKDCVPGRSLEARRDTKYTRRISSMCKIARPPRRSSVRIVHTRADATLQNRGIRTMVSRRNQTLRTSSNRCCGHLGIPMGAGVSDGDWSSRVGAVKVANAHRKPKLEVPACPCFPSFSPRLANGAVLHDRHCKGEQSHCQPTLHQ
jgi:hypothetical protein